MTFRINGLEQILRKEKQMLDAELNMKYSDNEEVEPIDEL